jgi:hypothetical protein
MGFFTSFAKGFAEGEVAKIQAINEKQRLDDLRKAELNDSITLMEKEYEINAKKENDKANKQKEKMNKILLDMGFPQEYIDQEAQFALMGPDYLNTWYSQRVELYQSPVWHKSKINFHPNPNLIGKFVWEAELNSNTSKINNVGSDAGGGGADVFDSKQVVNDVAENANISDNIVKSQFSETSFKEPLKVVSPIGMFTPVEDYSTYTPHEWIHGKASTDVAGEGKQFISLDGKNIVTAYAKLNHFTDGEGKLHKKEGGVYYVPTNYGPMPVDDYFKQFGVDYVGDDSENFTTLQAASLFDGVKENYNVRYMVVAPNLKNTWTVNGVGISYTDPSRMDTISINRMPNELALITNLDLAEFSTVQQQVPGRGEETTFNAYEIGIKEYTEMLSNMGYDIQLIDSTKESSSVSSGDIEATEKLLNVKKPIKVTVGETNNAINALVTVSDYLTNDDIRTRQVGDDTIIEMPGMETNAKAGALFAAFNELVGRYSDQNISEEILKELYGSDYTKYMSPNLNDLVSRLALYHNDLDGRAIEFHTGILTKMKDDDFKKEFGFGKTDTTIASQAQELADRDLENLRTSSDMINLSNKYKNITQKTLETEEKAFEEKIGGIFRVNTQGGFPAAKSIINDIVSQYVNDPNDAEQRDDLVAALVNHLGPDRDNIASDVDFVMDNYIIPELFPGMLDKPTSDLTKGEVKAAEESVAVTKWLEKDALTDTQSSRIRAGAGGQRETFVVPLDDSASGSLAAGRLYDTDTGYLLFKSPTLPAGHVEPMPNIGDKFFGNKTRENWITLWDKTHDRATGRPKEQ